MSRSKGKARITRFISRTAIARGFLGGSRGWAIVASVTIALRVVKRVFGGTPETAYSETLRPGDCLIITHGREARVIRAPS